MESSDGASARWTFPVSLQDGGAAGLAKAGMKARDNCQCVSVNQADYTHVWRTQLFLQPLLCPHRRRRTSFLCSRCRLSFVHCCRTSLLQATSPAPGDGGGRWRRYFTNSPLKCRPTFHSLSNLEFFCRKIIIILIIF